MPMREYYTVDRSPAEIRELWDWAAKECRGKIEHETPYAMGVLATLEYLMGAREEPPQAYKGVFTLPNVLRQCEQPDEIRSVCDAGVDKALHDDLQPLRSGNPKTLFYDAPPERAHFHGRSQRAARLRGRDCAVKRHETRY